MKIGGGLKSFNGLRRSKYLEKKDFTRNNVCRQNSPSGESKKCKTC
jgi:hypothetical protein